MQQNNHQNKIKILFALLVFASTSLFGQNDELSRGHQMVSGSLQSITDEIEISSFAQQDVCAPGGEISWVISVVNSSQKVLRDAKIEYELDSGWFFNTAEPEPEVQSNTLHWSMPKILAGQQLDLVVEASLASDLNWGVILQNHLSLGDSNSVIEEFQEAQITTNIQPSVRLSFEDSPNLLTPGSTVSTHLLLQNRGNVSSTFHEIQIDLPKGLTLVNSDHFVQIQNGQIQLKKDILFPEEIYRIPLTFQVPESEKRNHIFQISANCSFTEGEDVSSSLALIVRPLDAPADIDLALSPTILPGNGNANARLEVQVRDQLNRPVSDGTQVILRSQHGNFNNGQKEVLFFTEAGKVTALFQPDRLNQGVRTLSIFAEAGEIPQSAAHARIELLQYFSAVEGRIWSMGHKTNRFEAELNGAPSLLTMHGNKFLAAIPWPGKQELLLKTSDAWGNPLECELPIFIPKLAENPKAIYPMNSALSGQLLNKSTEDAMGIDNVQVFLKKGDAILDSVKTNTYGQFTFVGLEAGSYDLSAKWSQDMQAFESQVSHVLISAGEWKLNQILPVEFFELRFALHADAWQDAADTIQVQVNLQNNSNMQLENGWLEIPLPIDLEFLHSSPDFQQSGRSLLLTIGDIPGGEHANANLFFAAQTPISDSTKIQLNATLQSDNAGLLKQSVEFQLHSKPQLNYELLSQGQMLPGQIFEYQLKIRNDGSDLARNVMVKAEISPKLRLIELPPAIGDLYPGQERIIRYRTQIRENPIEAAIIESNFTIVSENSADIHLQSRQKYQDYSLINSLLKPIEKLLAGEWQRVVFKIETTAPDSLQNVHFNYRMPYYCEIMSGSTFLNGQVFNDPVLQDRSDKKFADWTLPSMSSDGNLVLAFNLRSSVDKISGSDTHVAYSRAVFGQMLIEAELPLNIALQAGPKSPCSSILAQVYSTNDKELHIANLEFFLFPENFSDLISDENGRLNLQNIPSGNYTLRLRNNSLPEGWRIPLDRLNDSQIQNFSLGICDEEEISFYLEEIPVADTENANTPNVDVVSPANASPSPKTTEDDANDNKTAKNLGKNSDDLARNALSENEGTKSEKLPEDSLKPDIAPNPVSNETVEIQEKVKDAGHVNENEEHSSPEIDNFKNKPTEDAGSFDSEEGLSLNKGEDLNEQVPKTDNVNMQSSGDLQQIAEPDANQKHTEVTEQPQLQVEEFPPTDSLQKSNEIETDIQAEDSNSISEKKTKVIPSVKEKNTITGRIQVRKSRKDWDFSGVKITMNGKEIAPDANGRLVMDDLPDGLYRFDLDKSTLPPGLKLKKSFFRNTWKRSIRLRGGEHKSLLVLLEKVKGFKREASIKGQLRFSDLETPLEGWKVFCDGQHTATSDENGEFTFKDLQPGKHRLKLDSNQFKGEWQLEGQDKFAWDRIFEIGVGQEMQVELSLIPAKKLNLSLNKVRVPQMESSLTCTGFPLDLEHHFLLERVFFKSGEFQLNDEMNPQLSALGEFVSWKDALQIEVSGHTDNLQPTKKMQIQDNTELSSLRAKSLYAFIQEHAREDLQLQSIKGYSAKKPIANNYSKLGRAKNRRAEVLMLTGGKGQAGHVNLEVQITNPNLNMQSLQFEQSIASGFQLVSISCNGKALNTRKQAEKLHTTLPDDVENILLQLRFKTQDSDAIKSTSVFESSLHLEYEGKNQALESKLVVETPVHDYYFLQILPEGIQAESLQNLAAFLRWKPDFQLSFYPCSMADLPGLRNIVEQLTGPFAIPKKRINLRNYDNCNIVGDCNSPMGVFHPASMQTSQNESLRIQSSQRINPQIGDNHYRFQIDFGEFPGAAHYYLKLSDSLLSFSQDGRDAKHVFFTKGLTKDYPFGEFCIHWPNRLHNRTFQCEITLQNAEGNTLEKRQIRVSAKR